MLPLNKFLLKFGFMLHSLVQKQLKKCRLNSKNPPSIEGWKSFLERVSRAYAEADEQKLLLESSLSVSSQKMREVCGELRKSETRYVLAAQGANDGLWDWDLTGGDIFYSPRWMEMLGIEPDEKVVPSKEFWLDSIHPSDYAEVIRDFSSHLQGKTERFENEHRILHLSGEYRWVLMRGLATRDETGKALRIAGSMTDITERKMTEEKLAHDALHDSLTGLPNRKRLMSRLTRSLERLQKSPDHPFAVYFVDLDRFKIVNDTLGHQAGDDLLLRISERLELAVRPGDMVARLGGDEFVIVVESIKSEQQLVLIAERILQAMREPAMIAGQKIYTGASIGIVFASPAYAKADDLLRDADLAMYRAKSKGKDSYEIFDTKIHSGTLTLLQLEIDLRRAIENDEFVLNYQPVISLHSEEIVGFEALVRWNHPIRGIIAPDDFLKIAEETGLILPIGRWVLSEACRQLSRWQQQFPNTESLVMNINLCARELEQKDLIPQIKAILQETGLKPECLKLEITESGLMHNAEAAVETVKKLREIGVFVSIDDFGTGYSSLSYLHRLPIETLKVDRSFINRIEAQDEHSDIIQTIVKLAASLGMEVVAEGVENEQQLNFLKDMNCEFGQGFYYSEPLDSLAAAGLLEKSLQAEKVKNYQIGNIDLGEITNLAKIQ
jgi:diguanylate cyclase (GGDEF)-like protein/PAS domain S-box-containing protein